jgi:hypothetical protein
MNIHGGMSKRNSAIQATHLIEVLAASDKSRHIRHGNETQNTVVQLG